MTMMQYLAKTAPSWSWSSHRMGPRRVYKGEQTPRLVYVYEDGFSGQWVAAEFHEPTAAIVMEPVEKYFKRGGNQ